MNELQIVCIVWNVVGFVLIAWGDYYLLARRVCMYGEKMDAVQEVQILRTRKWIWSLFYECYMFYICCISMFLTAVSYVYIFIDIVCVRDWSGHDMRFFAVSNAFFVSSSAAYAFLVFSVFKRRGYLDYNVATAYEAYTLVCLFITALSAVCTLFSLIDSGAIIIVASIFIFIHCLYLDWYTWGVTWISDIDKKKDISHSLITYKFLGSALDQAKPSVFDGIQISRGDCRIHV